MASSFVHKFHILGFNLWLGKQLFTVMIFSISFQFYGIIKKVFLKQDVSNININQAVKIEGLNWVKSTQTSKETKD